MNKFKVWCKDNKEWEKDLCVLTPDGRLLTEFRDRLIPLKPDNHIIVFYIGQEDKNNNELYENDLVLYRNKTWQIVFIDSAFLLKDFSSKCTEYLKHEYIHWSQTEKVCSIYENPKLLKKKSEYKFLASIEDLTDEEYDNSL
jgi:hypothetical protein